MDGSILTASDPSFPIGREISTVTSDENMIDATLHLSGGIQLVMHTDTDLDSWSPTSRGRPWQWASLLTDTIASTPFLPSL